MVSTGFGARSVLTLTGITYRQLDYWARTGLVGSSIRGAAGRGSRRVYSFQDLVALRVVAKLREAGVSVQAIRRAVRWLRGRHDRPLVTLALTGQGKKVHALTEDPARLIEATADGQVVLAISIASVARDVERGVEKLGAPREFRLKLNGHPYRVVATPDLAAGGFSVEVPELPGCRTEADDLPEARRMVREAILAWLSVDEPSASRRNARSR